MPRSRPVRGLLLVVSFVVVAALQTWPLPIKLSTHLTGEPGGDTGVYVWNIWVFRHELMAQRWPMTTTSILPIGGPADLSQHNYTIASNLIALPLLSVVDVVTAFNLVYFINFALCAVGMVVLVRRCAQTSGLGNDWAGTWLAGLLFASSPFLIARGTAHFSLAAAAPLPFIAYWVDRWWESGRSRDGAIAGACVAWAAFSDPYYLVYGVLLGAAVVAGRSLSIDWSRRAAGSMGRRLVDGLLIALVFGIVARLLTGLETLTIGDRVVSVRTLYTPMLLLTILSLLRLGMTWRAHAEWTPPAAPRAMLGSFLVMSGVAAVLISPLLLALASRLAEGRLVSAPVLWRSSAPGADLLSFLLPNPHHPLAPQALVDWFAREPGRYEENVVSIPWTALLLSGVAWRWAGWRPNRLWLVVALGAMLLALGPFLRIAGLDTHIPGPWAVVRYLPVISEARMPSRFGVLMILATAVLFSSALGTLRARFRRQSAAITWATAVLLSFELLAAPRQLYSAGIPAVYDVIAADSRDIRVLQLPIGVRDGLSSLGDFSARSQFYQTYHDKNLIGGYLSRVSDVQKERFRSHPYLKALLEGSEGRTLDPATREAASQSAAQFLTEMNVGYVVIDRARVDQAFASFAIETMALRLIGTTGQVFLYVPAVGTPDARLKD